MLISLLPRLLLLLCGAGILLAWTHNQLPWHVFEVLAFGALVLWSFQWLRDRAKGAWSWLFLPLLAIAAWGVLQLRMGWTVYAFATESDVIRWGTYFAVCFLGFQLFGHKGSGSSFRRTFAIYALIVAVISVLQYFAGNGKIFWLFETREIAGLGPFLNRDHFASFVALALPAGVVEMVRRPHHRWFYGVVTAGLYAAVIAGASRAGFILVTLELLLLLLLLGFSGRAVLAVAALTAVFVVVVGWESLYERLSLPDPYAGRREVAAATVDMFKSNPWKGFGLGTWTDVYPAYAHKDFGVFVNAAHNDWLQWAADGGIFVPFCMLIVFLGSLLVVRRVPWALGVPLVFLHSLVDFPMQGRFLPAVVFLVLGVAARRARMRQAIRAERA